MPSWRACSRQPDGVARRKSHTKDWSAVSLGDRTVSIEARSSSTSQVGTSSTDIAARPDTNCRPSLSACAMGTLTGSPSAPPARSNKVIGDVPASASRDGLISPAPSALPSAPTVPSVLQLVPLSLPTRGTAKGAAAPRPARTSGGGTGSGPPLCHGGGTGNRYLSVHDERRRIRARQIRDRGGHLTRRRDGDIRTDRAAVRGAGRARRLPGGRVRPERATETALADLLGPMAAATPPWCSAQLGTRTPRLHLETRRSWHPL